MLDLLQTDANNAFVVMPNTCVVSGAAATAIPKTVATSSAAEAPVAVSATTCTTAAEAPPKTAPAVSRPSEAAVYTQSLLKIRVPAAAVLAERRLPLGNVLHIAPGTVLKFGKCHQQPIELEVGGRRVAVGEAVTIGERFGVRITTMTP